MYHLDLSDMDSSKARKQMIIIGTNIIGIFVSLMIGVFSSFHPVMASLANQDNTTSSMTLPIADTPFYRENITVSSKSNQCYSCGSVIIWKWNTDTTR
jgi:hypothetical protein